MISIVIPCKNEAQNIPPLLDEIAEHLGDREIEVIVVNDGSTDNTPEVLAAEAARHKFPVRHLRHTSSVGQSLSLRSGVLAASGTVIATIDGDGQNDPKYIGPLVDTLIEAGPADRHRLRPAHQAQGHQDQAAFVALRQLAARVHIE